MELPVVSGVFWLPFWYARVLVAGVGAVALNVFKIGDEEAR